MELPLWIDLDFACVWIIRLAILEDLPTGLFVWGFDTQLRFSIREIKKSIVGCRLYCSNGGSFTTRMIIIIIYGLDLIRIGCTGRLPSFLFAQIN